ncbi:MAG: hypothetical protein OXI67_05080 [Candidatus Poribacteria bacterium]|nr:hypothetical protein [Candidatus Poribacteria bacterium]
MKARSQNLVGGESWRIPYGECQKAFIPLIWRIRPMAFIPGECLNGIHTVDLGE